jgi:hypothetical protein
MKITLLLIAILYLQFVCPARSQVLFDDFNAPTLNTSLWQVQTPLGDSQMSASGGNAIFFQRGTLTSQQELPTAFQIVGSFAFTGGDHDIFSVMFGTDGQLDPNYGQFANGTLALFAFRGGDDGDQTGQQNIYLTTGAGETINLGIASFLFQQNTFYDFKITYDGYNVQLFLEDLATPLLSGSTTYSAGQLLGIQNRGYVPWYPTYNNQVSLDYISVSAVPEPSINSLLVLGICFQLIRVLRSRQIVN